MVRLSMLEDTAKAMRQGMLALIRPVITSTDGALGGHDHVDARRAGQLGQAA